MSDSPAVESHLEGVGNHDLHPSRRTGLSSLSSHNGMHYNAAAAQRAPAQFHVLVPS